MLDLIAIFTTSGVLLFYKDFEKLKFDVLDRLIQNHLSKDKNDPSVYLDPYRVLWAKSIELNIFFVIAFKEL